MSFGVRFKQVQPYVCIVCGGWIFWRGVSRWLGSGEATPSVYLESICGLLLIWSGVAQVWGQYLLRRAIARSIQTVRRLHDGEHVIRPATDADFAALNRHLYGYGKVTLESLGYQMLGDYVDQTLVDVIGQLAPMRIMMGPNGESCTNFFQNPDSRSVKVLAGKEVLLISFDTELSDGTIISTENLSHLDFMTHSPAIEIKRYDPFLPLARLAALHAERVGQHLARFPEVRVNRMETIDDVMRLSRRTEKIRNDYRRSIGWLLADELRGAHLANGGQEKTANTIRDAAVRVRRNMGLVTDGTGV